MTYARYGDSRYPYGTTDRLYGLGTDENNYLWTIQIDWDNDGLFDGSNEARYCIDLDIDRGMTDTYDVSDKGDVGYFVSASPGICNLTFDNATKRFSSWAESTDSLGLSMAPGKKMRVLVRVDSTGTDMPLFAGVTKKIKEDKVNRTVTVECTDGIEMLQSAETNVPFSPDAVRNKDTIFQLLTNSIANWKWGWDISLTYWTKGNYFRNYNASQSAYKELKKLARSFFGVFYIDAEGNGVIRTFGYVPGAFSVSSPQQADYLKEIDTDLPWDNVITEMETEVERYDKGSTDSVLWDMGFSKLQVSASTDVTFVVNYSVNNVSCITDPDSVYIGSTDFTANDAEDGTGTDKTASVSVDLVPYVDKCFITITNADPGTIYMQTLFISGTPYVKNNVRLNADNIIDTGLFTGSRKMYISEVFGINNYTEGVGLGYPHISSPYHTRQFTIRRQNYSGADWYDIMDMVGTVGFPGVGLDGMEEPYEVATAYWHVWRIKHKWLSRNGQELLTTYHIIHNPADETTSIT